MFWLHLSRLVFLSTLLHQTDTIWDKNDTKPHKTQIKHHLVSTSKVMMREKQQQSLFLSALGIEHGENWYKKQ